MLAIIACLLWTLSMWSELEATVNMARAVLNLPTLGAMEYTLSFSREADGDSVYTIRGFSFMRKTLALVILFVRFAVAVLLLIAGYMPAFVLPLGCGAISLMYRRPAPSPNENNCTKVARCVHDSTPPRLP